MDQNTTIKTIIETLYRQFFIINAMSEGLGGVITLMHKKLDKCSTEECDRLSTFSSDDCRSCDRHYEDNVGLIEDDEAESVRVVQDYIDTKKTLSALDTIH